MPSSAVLDLLLSLMPICAVSDRCMLIALLMANWGVSPSGLADGLAQRRKGLGLDPDF